MQIKISTNSKEWTDFEKEEWEKADKEHYGQAKNWDKKNFHLTATEGNETIGSLRMEIRGKVAYIDAIIVASNHRKKGVGKNLMNKAEELAKENNSHKIYLQSGENWSAVKFYQDLGYKITSKLPNHYFNVDFVELTKFL